jgi:hypothetical protein
METILNEDVFAVDGKYRRAYAEDWGKEIVTFSDPTIHNWTVGDKG